MLAAVSSWEPHPALQPSEWSAQSSHYSSPPPPIHARPPAEQDAIAALLSMAGCAIPHRAAAAEAGSIAGPSQSSNATRQSVEPPARLGPNFASATEAIAGPSRERAPVTSTVRPTTDAYEMVEVAQTPSSPVACTESDAGSDSSSEAGSSSPRRQSKRKAEAMEDEPEPSHKRQHSEEPEMEVVRPKGGPALREYYIEQAKWIGKDRVTGEDMNEVPGRKSPASAYQVHILTWVYDNVTPYPESFWRAMLAIKLYYNYDKIGHWFTNQRQRVARQRKKTGMPPPDDLQTITLHGRKQKMRPQALESDSRWTDGRFFETIDMLIADRQRQFEEDLANHIAKKAAERGNNDNPAEDSDGDGGDVEESEEEE